MRHLWSAAARTLGGLGLILALLIGTGAGLFHAGQALANTSGRRADMMPVGTARQIDRLKRLRPQRP